MILSLGVTAFAAQTYAPENDQEIKVEGTDDLSDGSGETAFWIIDKSDTVPTYQISVTVPLKVTFAVAKDGTTSVPAPTAYRMLNHSYNNSVSVTKIQTAPVQGSNWTLVAAGNEGTEKVKKVSMKIKGIDLNDTISGKTDGLSDWTMAAPNDAQRVDGVALELPMEAKAAPQTGDGAAAEEVFKVTYTISTTEVTA